MIFSVFTIADFIASSLEKPFWTALQYFLEKLFEILFWSKLTLGSDESNATTVKGLNKPTNKKNKTNENFNKATNQYSNYNISIFVVFSIEFLILKSNIKFQFIKN